jgi:hypothetical protein
LYYINIIKIFTKITIKNDIFLRQVAPEMQGQNLSKINLGYGWYYGQIA